MCCKVPLQAKPSQAKETSGNYVLSGAITGKRKPQVSLYSQVLLRLEETSDCLCSQVPLRLKETSGWHVLSGAITGKRNLMLLCAVRCHYRQGTITGKRNLRLACAVQVPLQAKENSG